MKLITKTNRNFIAVLLLTLPISLFALYFTLQLLIYDEVDEKLKLDELRIIQQLEKGANITSIEPIIEVTKLNNIKTEITTISNTYLYDPLESEEELFRELVSYRTIKNQPYLIKVRQSIIEGKDFLLATIFTFGFNLLLFSLLMYVYNQKSSKKLWKPFYANINRLQHFSLTDPNALLLEHSSIDEFETLKSSIEGITLKIQKDYRTLKEFTENASHEIQTPLTIILMTLDEIIQDEQTPENSKRLYSCYQAAQRLSKLNEKLLLLAKVDNSQFKDRKEINFRDLISIKQLELTPLLDDKSLEVSNNFTGDFMLNMDSTLANILITNILSNAIKHNYNGGSINISMNEDSITFINSTTELCDTSEILDRFKKGKNKPNSIGLGLSIVNRIIQSLPMKIELYCDDTQFLIALLKQKSNTENL